MKQFITIFLICMAARAQAQTDAALAKGNEYYQLSQYELAEAQYRKVLDKDPNNVTAQYNLSNALQQQKKYDEAIKLLDQLGESNAPKTIRSAAYYNQGVANTKAKNLEASIESYKSALRLDPADKEARENLQKALLELKKKQQQQQKDQQKKQDPKMSQKEAEQKLKLLDQKEKELHQRQQDKSKQTGQGQSQDW